MYLLTLQVNGQQKAVMILLDGIPTDVIQRVSTPNMDEIAHVGGFATAYVGGMKDGYSQTPTVSAPGYMNMITGVWAHKHNVRDNAVETPNYHYWNIFRVAETVNPSLETAIFSTWEDNRTKLIGEGKESAGSIKLDYSFDGFEVDTIRFPHKADRKFIFDIDELVSKEAARYIEEEAPDLSWVYLEFTDDMGHKFGDSPEMDDAVMKADVQVGRIWEAIKKRETMGEDWMIVITTDHGRKPKDGKGHGGQTDRERTTWICTNQSNLNESFNQHPGIVDIMPSLLTHMKINPPDELKAEIDGVSFTDKISLNQLTANYEGGKLLVSWNPLVNKGKAEILISETNNYATGGKDVYIKLTEVKVSKGRASIDFDQTADFYKILLKAPYNWSNAWLVK
ncbi:MAG: alkaline phosphatase family protein [Cyclobacteriaceae bacterium]